MEGIITLLLLVMFQSRPESLDPILYSLLRAAAISVNALFAVLSSSLHSTVWIRGRFRSLDGGFNNWFRNGISLQKLSFGVTDYIIDQEILQGGVFSCR